VRAAGRPLEHPLVRSGFAARSIAFSSSLTFPAPRIAGEGAVRSSAPVDSRACGLSFRPPTGEEIARRAPECPRGGRASGGSTIWITLKL